MVIFSKKYRHVHGGFLPGWLVYFGIMVLSVFNIGFSFLGSLFPVMTDLAIINVVLWGMMVLKFQADNPYTQGTFISLLFIHGVISVSFISMLVYNGIYVKKRYSVSNVLYSSLLASILFFATVYFVKAVAFSRLVFAASSVIISLLLVGWREIIPNAVRHLKMRIFVRDRIIIIGDGYVPVLSHIMKSVEDQKSGRILGILWSGSTENPGEFLGYPVLGTIDDLKTVLKRYKVDMLFIVTQYPWYSKIIELLSTEKMHHLTIRWVSHDIFEKKGEPLPKEIVLHDLTV
jgi:FlaA1/EpsC-like NDP-sugar epimerase